MFSVSSHRFVAAIWVLSLILAVPATVIGAENRDRRLAAGVEATGVLEEVDFEQGYVVINGTQYAAQPSTLVVYSGEHVVNTGRLESGWNVRYYYLPARGQPILLEIHLLSSALAPEERG
jgi:hypothetical protein